MKQSNAKKIVLALGLHLKKSGKVNEYSGLTDKEEHELWEKAHQADIKEAIKNKNWSWLHRNGD